MFEVNFNGPFALLPNADEVPFLHAHADCWVPGVYLWTYLYNKAYRVNFIGANSDNIAERHATHLADYLSGKQTIYDADELLAGQLSPLYQPHDDQDRFISAYSDLMRQLSAVRVFVAPLPNAATTMERIRAGLIAHFQRLGGRAEAWLNNEPTTYTPSDYPEPLTVRIGRPAFIASLPDEMHL